MGLNIVVWVLISISPAFSAGLSEQIIIDQFGWRSSCAKKIVLFTNPVKGQNWKATYIPGPVFEIRRASDGSCMFRGDVTQWRGGKIHSASGDQVWWGDFSSLRKPGEYYVYDPKNDLRSFNFEIRDDIYNEVLKTSVRTFYYQRCGIDIKSDYGGNWTHEACHNGLNQDVNAQLWVNAPQGRPRDVSGGWHDAGDFNKYIPMTGNFMWDLMLAYELNPEVFTDDYNIPESGNGVPDILDEIKWELDWMLKMQWDDGGVSNRVGVTTFFTGDKPEADTQARYYTGKSTRATSTFSAITAHAARVYENFGRQFPGYAEKLRTAAESAWSYLERNKIYIAENNTGLVLAEVDMAKPGDATNDDKRKRIWAAAELFRTTKNKKYKAYFDNNYNDIPGTSEDGRHPIADNYFDSAKAWDLRKAFIIYAQAPGADAVISNQIRTSLKNGADYSWLVVGQYDRHADPYRGFVWQTPGSSQYTWGSNLAKCRWAQIAIFAREVGVNLRNDSLYREIAEEYLHYFHGRNPLSLVFLSNMGPKGARLGGDKSVMEIYHGWFHDGSPLYDGISSTFGPGPGFLVGGPNEFFSITFSAKLAPPSKEPPMKSFKDWNTGWNGSYNENSWEITEFSTSYQAAYTLLVSYFCMLSR